MNASDRPRLFWLIPILLTVHNLEEAVTMPEWLPLHEPLLRKTLSVFNHLQFSTPQLYLSLFLVTAIPSLVVYNCMNGERSKLKQQIMLTLQSIIFWNALMPHISGVFVLGMYNPGAISAAVLTVPFSSYLFYVMQRDSLIDQKTLLASFLSGLILYLPIVYINHLLAKNIIRLL